MSNVTNYRLIDLRRPKRQPSRKSDEYQQGVQARRAQRALRKQQQEQERLLKKSQPHANKGRVFAPEVLERLRQQHKERAERRRLAREQQK